MLDDQGLAAAIVSLAEWDSRVNVGALPERRCSARTEAAAYFCVAGVARSGGRLDISGTVQDGWLVLDPAASMTCRPKRPRRSRTGPGRSTGA